jgi:hypothetical protein
MGGHSAGGMTIDTSATTPARRPIIGGTGARKGLVECSAIFVVPIRPFQDKLRCFPL